MPSMTIRDVPDSTHAELSARAARSGRSLQEYVRIALIDLADRPTAEDWKARLREHRRHLASGPTADQIVDDIRADRG